MQRYKLFKAENMEPISTIRISNPSVALVNIINNALKQKKDRMRQMREKIKK